MASVAGILILSVLAYGRFRDDLGSGSGTNSALVGYTTLVLLWVLITSKALSPQYMVWLLPVMPLLPLRHAALLLGACALTSVLFPWQYWGLVRLEWPAVLLLNARNALLLVTATLLLREYSPGRVRWAPTASSRPLPSG